MTAATDLSTRARTTPGQHLTAEERGILRGRLVATLEDLQAQVHEQEALVQSLARASDDENVTQREAALATAERAREAIDDTTRALDRIATDRYGTCASCGDPIPFERLEAIPDTELCVACPRSGGLFG